MASISSRMAIPARGVLRRSRPIAGPSTMAAAAAACSSSRATTAPAGPPPCPAPRPFHSTRRAYRSEDPGGRPNDGSHPTVYDDFYNILGPGSDDPGAALALSIESIKADSVTLSDGLVVQQPFMLINGSCFLWDAPTLDQTKALPSGSGWEAWTETQEAMEHAWKLLDVIEPKPEVLLLGTGASVLPPPVAIRSHLHSLGIQIEVQSSQNAASTFNVLSEEGRRVAIALLLKEPKPINRKLAAGANAGAGATTTGQSRAFSTSARNAVASSSTLAATAVPTSSAATYASSSSPSRASPRSRTNKDAGLTLHHFLLRSNIYSLYRSYIRATQSIPNSSARYETIQFYRPGFQKALDQTELAKARDLLDYQKRDFKRVAPGWGLTATGNGTQGGGNVIEAKFRGGRG